VLRFLLKRLAASLLVIVGVSLVIFTIARVIPGDPARIALGPAAEESAVEALRKQLSLDQPFPVQYWRFARGVLSGDLGQSLYTSRPVVTDLRQFLPATLELVFAATFLMIAVGIPLGVLAAHFLDRWPDHVARVVSLLGVAAPSFVWSVIFILAFAYALDLMPVIGRLSDDVSPPPRITGLYVPDALFAGDWRALKDALWHLALPSLALALSGIGQASRLTRSNMAQSYQRDYIGLARAYGFTNSEIAWKYALRPALIPTLTILGLDFAAKLGSAFLVEAVFSWPGMARYGVNAILAKDLNAIVGTVLVIGVGFVLINLVIDMIVALLDPRIRVRSGLA
jgi:peptide/nickel transport system permease protein